MFLVRNAEEAQQQLESQNELRAAAVKADKAA